MSSVIALNQNPQDTPVCSPHYSPRGFYLGDRVLLSDLMSWSERVAVLLQRSKQSAKKRGTWELHKQFIDLAIDLFSLLSNDTGRINPSVIFAQWVILQYKNPYLYGMRLNFLLETLRYIHTGHRPMTVFHWIDLLEDWPQRADSFCLTSSIQDEIEKNLQMNNALFFKWCAHPQGIEDMLWTLHTLFGRETNPRNNQLSQPSRLQAVKPLSGW